MNIDPAPGWLLELVNAVEEHEEAHPKGYRHPGSTDEISVCLFGALNKVPQDIRYYAAGFKAGYAAAVQERAAQALSQAASGGEK